MTLDNGAAADSQAVRDGLDSTANSPQTKKLPFERQIRQPDLFYAPFRGD